MKGKKKNGKIKRGIKGKGKKKREKGKRGKEKGKKIREQNKQKPNEKPDGEGGVWVRGRKGTLGAMQS